MLQAAKVAAKKARHKEKQRARKEAEERAVAQAEKEAAREERRQQQQQKKGTQANGQGAVDTADAGGATGEVDEVAAALQEVEAVLSKYGCCFFLSSSLFHAAVETLVARCYRHEDCAVVVYLLTLWSWGLYVDRMHPCLTLGRCNL